MRTCTARGNSWFCWVGVAWFEGIASKSSLAFSVASRSFPARFFVLLPTHPPMDQARDQEATLLALYDKHGESYSSSSRRR